MPTPTAPAEQPPGLVWDFTRDGIAKGARSLAAFAALYALLVVLGLKLHENTEALTIMWPSAGLLFMALWLSPRRNWIWILAVQLAIELSASALQSGHFRFATYVPFAVANSIDGMVGAFVASRLIETPRVPRMRNVLLFIASVAIGAAVSALVGGYADDAHARRTPEYVRELQIWWAGNWLGSLCIAPIVMGWAVRFHARQHSAPAAPAIEMMLIGFAMLAMTSWVFSAPPGGVTTILDMPFVLLAFVVVAAFRMPPRWSTILAAATAVLVSYFASHGLGPFAGDPSPFVRVGAVQLYLATLVVINFLLTVVLLEKRNAFQLLRTSEERYRNFIEHSSEAVWRVELSSPMDPHLPVDDQIAWLQTHAYVAESNLTYLRLNREMGLSEADARQWRTDMPWFAMFIRAPGRRIASGIFGGRTAVHGVRQFSPAQLHHGISRRHRAGLSGACLGRRARRHRAGRSERAAAPESGSPETLCAASWWAPKSARGAPPPWICTMASASSWWACR